MNQAFQPVQDLSIWIFSGFSLLMFLLVLFALKRVPKPNTWLALFFFVVLLISGASISGLVANHFVPFGPMLFATIFVFSIALVTSNSGRHLADTLPISFLIGFQFFRLPLELILHHWANIGTIPETMTWTGQNFDVLTGVLSVASLPLLKRQRAIAVVVNSVGFLLLLNVIRVVVMSSPLPFSWPLERPLLLVAHFPYALIGPLFVMPALIGHLLVFRKVFSKKAH